MSDTVKGGQPNSTLNHTQADLLSHHTQIIKHWKRNILIIKKQNDSGKCNIMEKIMQK